MIWLLRDIDFLSTLLGAANLSFEALLLGGVLYLLVIARPAGAAATVQFHCLRGIRWAALSLIVAELLGVVLSSVSLLGDSGLPFRDLLDTPFFLAGLGAALITLLLLLCARIASRAAFAAMVPLGLLLLIATVSTSHATGQMDHRLSLALATAGHLVGTAAWIGAMPFLIISLGRAESAEEARVMARRYSAMAMFSVALLLLAGLYMAWFYVGSWQGLYGTNYGVLLLAKIYLLAVMLLMGAGNWSLVRQLNSNPQPLLVRIRRFAEAEIGLGFTAILAAASMSAQPPAADVSDQVPLAMIVARMHPEIPRMTSPAASQLTPPTSIETAVRENEFQTIGASDLTDRKWSEYNHHWAGLIVLVAGLLAFASRLRAMRWARFWPLSFAGLSLFIFLRADPENWPLGPRPFWASLSAPDVLQHRAAGLLILCFAGFECAVQAGKLRARWASMIFPAMCALGAVILLTHNHAAADTHEDLLASLSHTPIALLGATAGWCRWLELRLPPSRASKIAGYVWPLFLCAAGLVLLNYREI
ncbi:MAG TPA: CopD family protein [Acidobacteriaceae bacterium]|nr:CopD family protein [Acidobacteriaceae bacterium]